ncbi:recombinase family protein [Protofrankia symbiont of Coriaria ruscifolia]|uniref:recombinase family protein n=1 Tax=Protofrankia symbiont of Coriaria ruscifolia TaxID=1306542 RepID=UPI003D6D85FD
MNTTNRQIRDAAAGVRAPKRAVIYLRVSTPSQVNTDYNPEGISIPAQREAGERKATELGAKVVNEFVEPGRTATNIDKRPVFQEMLAWVKAQKDVDYIIVYHFNRIFRNSIDAAITKRDLSKMGVRIVSTVLDMGESPESQMVETIIHAVDQYQSQASGADIAYKMSQKVKNGGSVGKAKIGYLNVREHIDGREIRTVALDEKRAPLVLKAFELYATGDYTGEQVHQAVTAAGLTSRPTKRTPEQPTSLNTLYEMLQDRYYVGYVTYKGDEYEGRHPAIVTSELFDRVQRVLALRHGGGTRERQHHHYLKGAIWCARCDRRFTIQKANGNGGTYFYFFCIGRSKGICDQPYLSIEQVEREVIRHYATIRLNEQFQQRLRRQLDDALIYELHTMDTLRKQLTARLEELSAKEDRFLDLIGDPGWPHNKIKQKLAVIDRERNEILSKLADTTGKIDVGRRYFLTALDLLRDPQHFYSEAGTSLRRGLNKVIFDKLYVDDGHVTAHALNSGLDELVEAGQPTSKRYMRRAARTHARGWAQHEASPVLTDEAGDDSTGAGRLDMILSGHGSNKTALVGDTGIEPVASTVSR